MPAEPWARHGVGPSTSSRMRRPQTPMPKTLTANCAEKLDDEVERREPDQRVEGEVARDVQGAEAEEGLGQAPNCTVLVVTAK